MLKHKTFYGHELRTREHDDGIQKFLDTLSENGHTFISINTISYGTDKGYTDKFRTEIAYRENPTRKVILEKIE